MKHISQVKQRTDFPKLPDGGINWDKLWSETRIEDCQEKGHIVGAPPHCPDGMAVCYVCLELFNAGPLPPSTFGSILNKVINLGKK